MTRTLAAIAIAPLAVVPILSLIFGPWVMTDGGWRSLIGILRPAIAVAYPATILIGLPIHLALVRQRCTRVRDYAVAGLLLGAVPVIGYALVAVVVEAQFAASGLQRAAIRNIEWGGIGAVVFGTCSAAVAMTFRAVVRASPS